MQLEVSLLEVNLNFPIKGSFLALPHFACPF